MTSWIAQAWFIAPGGKAKRKTARFECSCEWEAQASMPVTDAPAGTVRVVRDHSIRLETGACEWGCCDLRGTLTPDKAAWFKRIGA